jgi:hypothetical protein
VEQCVPLAQRLMMIEAELHSDLAGATARRALRSKDLQNQSLVAKWYFT